MFKESKKEKTEGEKKVKRPKSKLKIANVESSPLTMALNISGLICNGNQLIGEEYSTDLHKGHQLLMSEQL